MGAIPSDFPSHILDLSINEPISEQSRRVAYLVTYSSEHTFEKSYKVQSMRLLCEKETYLGLLARENNVYEYILRRHTGNFDFYHIDLAT